MSSVDWSTAPEGSEYWDDDYPNWHMHQSGKVYFWAKEKNLWIESAYESKDLKNRRQFTPRPQSWPEEDRITHIGQNGGDGLHYSRPATKSATDYLSAGMKILFERGKQYGSNGRECSFGQVAEAFNAITGNELSGSDVCMILAILKLVRQSAQPGKLHEDSLVDGVNYMALYAEVLSKEINLK